MRALVIKVDENEKKTAIRMMPYNNEDDKQKVYSYINEQQTKDFTNGIFCSYIKADIGFDIVFANQEDTILNFQAENPEYESYHTIHIPATEKHAKGFAAYKNWECVEKAKSLKLIKSDLYRELAFADRENMEIKIRDLGCEKNGEILGKISENIVKEIMSDERIILSLRTGENRKKENEITYRNWVDAENREMNCITYRNGGQAFSILLDSDMNILTMKYNNKVFEKGHEWIPMEEMEETKDCLQMIYDKLPEMKFNHWLADMGDNEKYEELKEGFNGLGLKVSEYYPLTALGTGYFTVENDLLRVAIQIEDKKATGFKYQSLENGKATMKWSEVCPEMFPHIENPLYRKIQELQYVGRLLTQDELDEYKNAGELSEVLAIYSAVLKDLGEKAKDMDIERQESISKSVMELLEQIQDFKGGESYEQENDQR